VIYNCIEKGLDVSNGGAFYNFSGVQAVGIANITDCLYSTNQTVFIEKIITYKRLKEVLDSNFKKQDFLRYKILNKYPKYGNNNYKVDAIAQKWSYLYNKEVEKYENPRGGYYQPGIYTVSSHVPLGKIVGAT